MSRVLLETAFVFFLLLANGFFAMSEIAVVSARRTRLDHLARRGDSRALAALRLAEHPNNFLATVQIGITLVGILAGVFGGATIARELAAYLNTFPAVAPRGEEIALPAVVLMITFLSLVIGELVPKRIALTNPERIASRIAPFMRGLARLARPAVWVLSKSSDILGALLRVPPPADAVVTDEEVTGMIASGARAGVFHPTEAAMVRRVFTLGDRRVSAVMTPRPEISWLDATQPMETLTRTIISSGHSRFPLADGSLDRVLGVVELRAVAAQCLTRTAVDLRAVMRAPIVVPEKMPVLSVLDRFRAEQQQLAFVADEYGGIAGIVTLADLAESVVGPLDRDVIVSRPDGSLLVDGMASFYEIAHRLDLSVADTEHDTLAGFIISRLTRLPRVGDVIEAGGYSFEIVDMDRHRIDRVQIMKRAEPVT